MPNPTIEQRLAVRTKPTNCSQLLQKWQNLLFLHWIWDQQELQSHLPKGLYIDTFDGNAYLGLVPLYMQDIKPAFFGTLLPGINFFELNVRTYVFDDKGLPGVWFFSLDANDWLSVQIGKRCFHLPYYYSHFNVEEDLDSLVFKWECQRDDQKTHLTYQALDPIGSVPADSLEFFLVERYVLFAANQQGNIYQGRIHHSPYPLCHVKVGEWDQHVIQWDGLHVRQKDPDHCLFSPGVDVKIYPLIKFFAATE